jgi:hypothetical protein
MAFFGLFGEKINDSNIDSLKKEDKLLFSLTKEEVELGKLAKKKLDKARLLLNIATSNSRDLIDLAKEGKEPRHHDFSFEDVSGEFKDVINSLENSKIHSVSFYKDFKLLMEHISKIEVLLKNNSNKLEKNAMHEVELLKNDERILIGEFPSFLNKIDDLIEILKTKIIPFVSDLAEEITMNSSDIKYLSKKLSEVTSLMEIIINKVNSLNKILSEINHRMKKFEFKDKKLERELLKHLRTAREEIKRANTIEGGYDR